MESNTFENRLDLGALHEQVGRVRAEIGKIIVGQDELINLLITAILAEGHVLIEGVPGVAKTLTAKILSRVLSVKFSRIQFTPDLMPSDVIGTSVFNLKHSAFQFRAGPIFANTILIDEVNRAPAKTQAALFEVMEERQATVDGTTYPLDPPFLVVATQNPIDHEGTYRLPEAQLDRFLFKAVVHYPTMEEEVAIIHTHHRHRNMHDLSVIQPVMDGAAIVARRGDVHQVHVEDTMARYIAGIVHETRNNPSLFLGASPRASVALLNSSKAFAAIHGRDFVTPEDIKYLCTPVLRHRIILTPEKEMEGTAIEEVIGQIVDSVEVPR